VRNVTTRATQPDLFDPVVHSRAARLDTSPPQRPVRPFGFTGEGCDPDPTYVPPEWLRLPTDQPRPIAEPVARILVHAILARLQRRLS